MDDYSKYTWVYLLKFKADVFKIFHEFQALVERRFDRKIISMQTDWGGEYEKLNSFFRQIGISHQVSCPHTHQQNGSAERKHRHIIEVGLSLLAHASMPLKFWDEAFLAASYLINRIPNKVIDFETPLDRLFHQSPEYSSLRTFGCACWPHLRPYNSQKLQFRSKQCVFLGYSTQHKGFKCLDVSSGRIYVSRDVIFDESVFPFSSLKPNAGARLRAEITSLSPSLVAHDQGGEQIDNPVLDFPNTTNAPSENAENLGASDGVQEAEQLSMQPDGSDSSMQIDGSDSGTATPSHTCVGTDQPGASTSTEREGEAVGTPSLTHAPVNNIIIDTSAPAADASSTPDDSTVEQTILMPETGGEPTTPKTRLQGGIRKPKVYTDGTIPYKYTGFAATGEPQTLDEALTDERWRNAMDVEYTALMRNKTWHLVPPQQGKNIIDCKWVYKVKRKADGSLV